MADELRLWKIQLFLYNIEVKLNGIAAQSPIPANQYIADTQGNAYRSASDQVTDIMARCTRVEKKIDILTPSIMKAFTQIAKDSPKIVAKTKQIDELSTNLDRAVREAVKNFPFPVPIKQPVQKELPVQKESAPSPPSVPSAPLNKGTVMSQEVDNLEKAVAKTTGVINSAIVLINTTAQYIRDNVGNAPKLQEFADALDAKANDLGAAVESNPVPGA